MSRASRQRPRAEHARGFGELRAPGSGTSRARRDRRKDRARSRHDQDRAAERAHIREPVVGGRSASRTTRAAAACTGPSDVEQVDIDVGDDVGRDRERQRQQPQQRRAPGKLEGGHDPGGADADRRRSRPRRRRAAARSAAARAAAHRRRDAARGRAIAVDARARAGSNSGSAHQPRPPTATTRAGCQSSRLGVNENGRPPLHRSGRPVT